MSFNVFRQFIKDLSGEKHNLPNDTLKLGIVDGTFIPDINAATPSWIDYSANEVVTTGGYTAGGVSLTYTWTLTSNVWTLAIQSLQLDQNVLGFANGYYGIVYNDSAPSDEAIGFVALAGVSEQDGSVRALWNNKPVGVLGAVIQVQV